MMDNINSLDLIPLKALSVARNSFNSTSKPLNDYFYHRASQDEKRNLSKCFVLVNVQKNEIIGFYTLSSSSVDISEISIEKLAKGIRYPQLPVALLGRLAIDEKYAGQGYGKFLIIDAITKIKNSHLGNAALIVEAKDENAKNFYLKLGFIPFLDHNGKLFLPLNNLQL